MRKGKMNVYTKYISYKLDATTCRLILWKEKGNSQMEYGTCRAYTWTYIVHEPDPVYVMQDFNENLVKRLQNLLETYKVDVTTVHLRA